MTLTPAERHAQRVIGGIVRTGGARLNRERLMIWRPPDCGDFMAEASELTDHLEVLAVPYTVSATRGPTKATSKVMGWRINVAWDELPQLERWLPSLRRLIDAVEGGPER